MRRLIVPLVLTSSFLLSGCVASIAASALGSAVQSARSKQEAGREPLDPQAAREACSSHASQHGEVKIIDVENRSSSKLVVWGTVQKGQQRRSFECGYSGKVSGFKLREIRTRTTPTS